MPTMTWSVSAACVTVITFVATVHVQALPSERFNKAAPAIVVTSLNVIVSLVLTVASKEMICFVVAGVMMACLFDVTVSALSATIFLSHSYCWFCQACPTAAGSSHDRYTLFHVFWTAVISATVRSEKASIAGLKYGSALMNRVPYST
jgi:hypothetical protein